MEGGRQRVSSKRAGSWADSSSCQDQDATRFSHSHRNNVSTKIALQAATTAGCPGCSPAAHVGLTLRDLRAAGVQLGAGRGGCGKGRACAHWHVQALCDARRLAARAHAGLHSTEEAFIGWKGETYRPKQPGDTPAAEVRLVCCCQSASTRTLAAACCTQL